MVRRDIELDIDPTEWSTQRESVRGESKYDNELKPYTGYEYVPSVGRPFNLKALKYKNKKLTEFSTPIPTRRLCTYFKNEKGTLFAFYIEANSKHYYYINKDTSQGIKDGTKFDEFLTKDGNALSK